MAIGALVSLRDSLRELKTRLFCKQNFKDVAPMLLSGITRVKAKIYNGTEYTGFVYYNDLYGDCLMACEGTDGRPMMGYRLKEMYDIEVLHG